MVVGGATGISGIPKVFFTPGTLSLNHNVKPAKRRLKGQLEGPYHVLVS